eukprot:5965243-Prymnesium_polylepis.1
MQDDPAGAMSRVPVVNRRSCEKKRRKRYPVGKLCQEQSCEVEPCDSLAAARWPSCVLVGRAR